MSGFELDYDVQEVRLSGEHVFKVTTVANEALPLEMLLELQTRSEEISGQRLWEGSLLLCAYLAEASKKQGEGGVDLTGRAVLELGAGTGVVSMLAHSLGASPVVITDGDDKCVMMAEKNVEDNSISTEQAFVAVLRWGNTESTAAFCAALGEWNKTRRLVAKDGEEVDGRDGVKPKSEGTEESTVRADREEDHHPPSSAIEQQQAAEGCCPGAQQRAEHHQRLEEGAPSNPTAPTKESFDFILAGDVLYKESLLAPFLGTVREMLAAGGKMFLCHVPRAGVTYEIVEQALADAGFGFQVVSGNTKSTSSGWERGEGGENEAGENSNSISATAVGGIDLCVDDARRARLYEVQSIDPRFC